jgi:hypothetical protein
LTDWGDGSYSHAEKICAEKSARYHRLKQSSGSRGMGYSGGRRREIA